MPHMQESQPLSALVQPRPYTHDNMCGHALGLPHADSPEHITSHAQDIPHFTPL